MIQHDANEFDMIFIFISWYHQKIYHWGLVNRENKMDDQIL